MGDEGHNDPSCDWSAGTYKKGLGEIIIITLIQLSKQLVIFTILNYISKLFKNFKN